MTTTPPPGTDPLDAAIEAAWAAYMSLKEPFTTGLDRVRLMISAAAPHIEAAALRRAADEAQIEHERFNRPGRPPATAAPWSVVADWLRARAEAVGTEADHG
jgi:hypothetical protein